jgi:hypothetical protein
MARYFFDVINGTGLVEDEEGQDLPDFSAARMIAIEGARSIICEDVTAGFIDLSGRVEVKDVARHTLVSISFHEAVELRGVDIGPARD